MTFVYFTSMLYIGGYTSFFSNVKASHGEIRLFFFLFFFVKALSSLVQSWLRGRVILILERLTVDRDHRNINTHFCFVQSSTLLTPGRTSSQVCLSFNQFDCGKVFFLMTNSRPAAYRNTRNLLLFSTSSLDDYYFMHEQQTYCRCLKIKFAGKGGCFHTQNFQILCFLSCIELYSCG